MDNQKAELNRLLGSRREIIASLGNLSEASLVSTLEHFLAYPDDSFFHDYEDYISPWSIVKELIKLPLPHYAFKQYIERICSEEELFRIEYCDILVNRNFLPEYLAPLTLAYIRCHKARIVQTTSPSFIMALYEKDQISYLMLCNYLIDQLAVHDHLYDLVNKASLFIELDGHLHLTPIIQKQFVEKMIVELNTIDHDEILELYNSNSPLTHFYKFFLEYETTVSPPIWKHCKFLAK